MTKTYRRFCKACAIIFLLTFIPIAILLNYASALEVTTAEYFAFLAKSCPLVIIPNVIFLKYLNPLASEEQYCHDLHYSNYDDGGNKRRVHYALLSIPSISLVLAAILFGIISLT